MFYFHIHVNFPSSLLLLILYSIVIRKYTLHNFRTYKVIEACVVVYHVLYLERCSMYAWEECVFCYCWVMFCSCLLGLVGLYCYSNLLIPCWYSLRGFFFLCLFLKVEYWYLLHWRNVTSAFNSVFFNFTYFEALLVGT